MNGTKELANRRRRCKKQSCHVQKQSCHVMFRPSCSINNKLFLHSRTLLSLNFCWPGYLSSIHTKIPMYSFPNGRPQSCNPHNIHSVRLGCMSAPPDTRRLSERDPGFSYLWNSRKLPRFKNFSGCISR